MGLCRCTYSIFCCFVRWKSHHSLHYPAGRTNSQFPNGPTGKYPVSCSALWWFPSRCCAAKRWATFRTLASPARGLLCGGVAVKRRDSNGWHGGLNFKWSLHTLGMERGWGLAFIKPEKKRKAWLELPFHVQSIAQLVKMTVFVAWQVFVALFNKLYMVYPYHVAKHDVTFSINQPLHSGGIVSKKEHKY